MRHGIRQHCARLEEAGARGKRAGATHSIPRFGDRYR